MLQGNDTGVISEAGCPAVADPGADIVKLAHESGIVVIPLVGPSSILLALMASGLNGQSFAFNGYLPVKPLSNIFCFLGFRSHDQPVKPFNPALYCHRLNT